MLQEVKYVPKIKKNLLSIIMFDQSGLTTKILSGSSITPKEEKKMYVLSRSTVITHASVTSQTMHVTSQTMQDKAKLWYLRLGHISENDLVELRDKTYWEVIRWSD